MENYTGKVREICQSQNVGTMDLASWEISNLTTSERTYNSKVVGYLYHGVSVMKSK